MNAYLIVYNDGEQRIEAMGGQAAAMDRADRIARDQAAPNTRVSIFAWCPQRPLSKKLAINAFVSGWSKLMPHGAKLVCTVPSGRREAAGG